MSQALLMLTPQGIFIKADPAILWEWDDRLSNNRGGYRLTSAGAEVTGKRVGTIIGFTRLIELRDAYVEVQRERVIQLAGQYDQGELSIRDWVLAMREAIKETYINQYLLPIGGKSRLTSSDYGRIGAELKKQYNNYLQPFAEEIDAGDLSLEQIKVRAEMYISSSTQMFERANAARRGITLPAYPGDGSTDCKANCKCHWEITEQDDQWRCVWKLGAEDNCETCRERATTWNPYIVEKEESKMRQPAYV